MEIKYKSLDGNYFDDEMSCKYHDESIIENARIYKIRGYLSSEKEIVLTNGFSIIVSQLRIESTKGESFTTMTKINTLPGNENLNSYIQEVDLLLGYISNYLWDNDLPPIDLYRDLRKKIQIIKHMQKEQQEKALSIDGLDESTTK